MKYTERHKLLIEQAKTSLHSKLIRAVAYYGSTGEIHPKLITTPC